MMAYINNGTLSLGPEHRQRHHPLLAVSDSANQGPAICMATSAHHVAREEIQLVRQLGAEVDRGDALLRILRKDDRSRRGERRPVRGHFGRIFGRRLCPCGFGGCQLGGRWQGDHRHRDPRFGRRILRDQHRGVVVRVVVGRLGHGGDGGRWAGVLGDRLHLLGRGPGDLDRTVAHVVVLGPAHEVVRRSGDQAQCGDPADDASDDGGHVCGAAAAVAVGGAVAVHRGCAAGKGSGTAGTAFVGHGGCLRCRRRYCRGSCRRGGRDQVGHRGGGLHCRSRDDRRDGRRRSRRRGHGAPVVAPADTNLAVMQLVGAESVALVVLAADP